MKKLLLLLLLALVTGFGFAQTRQTGTVAVAKIDLYRDGGKPNVLMTGGGVMTFDAATNVKWTQRLIILGGGRGPGTISSVGFFDIYMPAAGTVITGMCGAANQTVGPAGVNMGVVSGGWSALWYQLPVGGNGTVNANFKISSYTSNCVIPDDYVLVAAYNADNPSVKMGTGQIISIGGSSASAGNDFLRSDGYGGLAMPNGTGDNAKNVFLDGNMSLKSMLNFRALNDGRNTQDGITWYPPVPADYGIFRTAGTWTGNPYQQLRVAFRTGIELDPSNTNTTTPSYTRSYVNIVSGGLRVERGATGLGTLSPTTKLTLMGTTGNRPEGGHIESYQTGAAHPTYQMLNWSTDNISSNYDVYFNGGAWTRSGTTGSFQIYKQSGVLNVTAGVAGAAGTAVTQVNAITVAQNARVRLPATPNYASVAAANADAALLAGTVYTVTTGAGKALYLK